MNKTTITLEEPIQRGETTIASVELRRPKAGELRGVNLTDLLQMDVSAIIKVVPRISTPMLTDADVANLDPADLTQMGSAVASFLLPKAELALAEAQAQALPLPSQMQ
ncbi:MAG: phage tail assembly protein [Rhodocyclaceae bacterium]|nr:phage tail assembly protein [Rhodocyclaceae bacterium]